MKMNTTTSKGIVIILLCFIWCSTLAQTYNLKFEEINADAVSLEVEVYISGSSAFKIGSSNLVFDYDNSIIDNPTLITEELSANYQVDAENKADEKVDFNLVYTDFNNPSNADDIAANPAWTKLGTVKFDVISPGSVANLDWLEAARSETVVYDSDGNRLTQGTVINGIISSALLPVELLSFEAKTRGKDVILNWSSASEINFDGYAIERSIDGIEFQEIGYQIGRGNPVTTTSYTWLDVELPYATTLYYRLKLLDLDGTIEYSDIRSVNINHPNLSGLTLSPNPSKGKTLISFESNIEGIATISIVNLEGKISNSQKLDINTGNNLINYEFHEMPIGTYQLIIDSKDQQWSTQLLIIK